jgi:hypothetical protein
MADDEIQLEAGYTGEDYLKNMPLGWQKPHRHSSGLSDAESDQALEEHEYYREVEKELRESLPRTDAEWLEIFPEAKKILPAKLKEWEGEKRRLVGIVKKHLRANAPEDYWQTRVYLQVAVMPRVEEAARQIARLKRLIWQSSPRPAAPGRITDTDIQHAKETPIASLLSSKLRKTGRTIETNCPLHQDRSPSFVIYTDTNTFHCFGCQQHGDSIELARKLNNLSFIEAVKFILRV